MVSIGSLPSACRDHWCDRWLKVGTAAAAVTESPAVDHRRGLGLGGDRDLDHAVVLAMHAGPLHEGLLIVMRHHLELAVGQALHAFGALKAARLAAKDIEHVVHAISLPLIPGRQTKQI